MKKVVTVILVVAIVLLSAFVVKKKFFSQPQYGEGMSEGEKENIVLEMESSELYSKGEIENAMKTVIDSFAFQGAILRKVGFKEDFSRKYTKIYLENGGGKDKDLSKDQVIVLYSDFYVRPDSGNPVLKDDSTYTDYMWTLTRQSPDSPWEIASFGY